MIIIHDIPENFTWSIEDDEIETTRGLVVDGDTVRWGGEEYPPLTREDQKRWSEIY